MRVSRAIILPALGLALVTGIVACTRPEVQQSMSSGELAFRNACQSCHSLPKPGKYTDLEWVQLVERYGSMIHLSKEKILAITSHLQTVN